MKGTQSLNHLLAAFFCSLMLAFATVPGVFADSDAGVDGDMSSLAESVININTANAEELADILNGVGLKKAHEIIAYRDTYGKFSSVDELANVKGIGSKTVDKNRNHIVAQ